MLVSSLTIGHQIYENKKPDIISFSIINFFGYLFFMLMPVEVLFAFYLSLEMNTLLILFVALLTAILAEIMDYIVGRLLSEHFIEKIINRKRYDRFKKYIWKYGALAILLFNLLPLASSVLSLAAGMLKYRFRKFLFYSILGLVIKYLVLIMLFSNGLFN